MLKKYFKKNIALPSDHGSWVFLFSPLIIGFFAGNNWSSSSILLIIAALAAFFMRQPAVMMIKSYAGRRSREDLPASRFWLTVYALVSLAALNVLVQRGFGYLSYLAVPGILVFAWHLYLVSKRAERHQIGGDVIASGALALAAPGAYWVSVGQYDTTGWWLWGLAWLQSAASIVYAFLRLGQRRLKEMPDQKEKFNLGKRTLLYSGFNFILTLILGLMGKLPNLIWIPFAIQFAESIYGTYYPAIGVKPTRIGIRQLIVSTIFTIVFIIIWQ